MTALTPVHEVRAALPLLDLAAVMDSLIQHTQWESHDDNRKEALFLRSPLPYYYAHDRGERPLFPQPEPLALQLVWSSIESLFRLPFEACFVNQYLSGEGSIGWHADDSPSIDQRRPVVIVSLGATRVLEVRSTEHPNIVSQYEQAHGSALVMLPGMQAKWQHRVERSLVLGKRVSLVFRGMSGYVREVQN